MEIGPMLILIAIPVIIDKILLIIVVSIFFSPIIGIILSIIAILFFGTHDSFNYRDVLGLILSQWRIVSLVISIVIFLLSIVVSIAIPAIIDKILLIIVVSIAISDIIGIILGIIAILFFGNLDSFNYRDVLDLILFHWIGQILGEMNRNRNRN